MAIIFTIDNERIRIFRKRFFEISSHLPYKEKINFIESRLKKNNNIKEVKIKSLYS